MSLALQAFSHILINNYESCNLSSFKFKINTLDMISLSSQPYTFFFLPLLGLCIGRPGFPQFNLLNENSKKNKA